MRRRVVNRVTSAIASVWVYVVATVLVDGRVAIADGVTVVLFRGSFVVAFQLRYVGRQLHVLT